MPTFATTPVSPLLIYTLTSLSSVNLPPFLTFDPKTLLIKRTPGLTLSPSGTYRLQLHAKDSHQQETLAYLTLQVNPSRPKVVTGNASCTQGLDYLYLDDEPEGEYRFGLA
jgi:hypothetical protein